MNRIFLVTFILLVIGVSAYAQQRTSNNPQGNQTKQEAQQFFGQAKNNTEEFDQTLADLRALNRGNRDNHNFNRLKREIESLESKIRAEETRIKAGVDRGTSVSSQIMNRLENFINQHKAKVEELDAFISTMN